MALVDYSSESESGTEEHDRAGNKTKQKLEGSPPLPPLPAAFHDLYASTVRPSPVDDPSLHQGRKRQIPHIAGNWPSHLYIEWHPTAAEHNALTSLLSRLQDSSVGSPELHTFLTSDLGAPLPLHISLSRPFVLATHERDVFVRRLVDAVRGCGVAPFELWPASPEPVGWHRSQESARSFLVLRVRSNSRGGGNSNPELVRLLSRCNELVASVGQLELYQWASETASGKEGEGEDSVGGAFHVSIAWSLGELTAELQRQTADVVAEQELTVGMPQIRIRVDAIKAKIGNVVTNISLPDAAKRSEAGNESKQASLFGI